MAFHHRVLQSAAAWSFLSTFLRLGANVLVLPLILHRLAPEQLGLWYVFGALGGFAALLDFGFEGTVSRLAAYVWGGARRLSAFGFHAEGHDAGQPNRPLFSDLLATLQAYYRAAGLGVLLLLGGGGGWWIWIKTAGMPEASSLRAAWLVYALGAGLNFISGRWPALLTGIGGLRSAQQISILSLLCYYGCAVAGLCAGLGLWSLVIGTLAMGFCARLLGRIRFARLAELPGGLPEPKFHPEIFAAIWPHAWRLGLVSLGAFLIVQANTLVCSAFLGLAVTASYGLSFQVVMILSGLSSVWVQVKIPEINQLRIRGENLQIARLFASRIRLTVLTFWLGAGVLMAAGPLVLGLIGSKTVLLPPGLLALFCLIQFLEMHHSQYAGLVLSENLNPFLKPALLSGVAIIGSSVALTPHLGVLGMLLSTGLVQLCYNNWWPILRALRGLHLRARDYWLCFFFLRPLGPAKSA